MFAAHVLRVACRAGYRADRRLTFAWVQPGAPDAVPYHIKWKPALPRLLGEHGTPGGNTLAALVLRIRKTGNSPPTAVAFDGSARLDDDTTLPALTQWVDKLLEGQLQYAAVPVPLPLT